MKKLTIYTGTSYRDLDPIEVTYRYPENSSSPWDQMEWLDAKLLEEEEFSLKTFSPYILNYLNLLLKKGDLTYETLDVFEVVVLEDGEVDFVDLKIQNEGVYLVDARLLSDPITYIYAQYNELANSGSEQRSDPGV